MLKEKKTNFFNVHEKNNFVKMTKNLVILARYKSKNNFVGLIE